VIVAVTIAPEPYVVPEWLAPGTLFVSISSLDPTVDVIRQADVLVCDVWEEESGHAARPFARALAEGAVAREDVVELGDLVAGKAQGRTAPEQRVFVSLIGLHLHVVAAFRGRRRGEGAWLGTLLALWVISPGSELGAFQHEVSLKNATSASAAPGAGCEPPREARPGATR
jgi:hypothetical protein